MEFNRRPRCENLKIDEEKVISGRAFHFVSRESGNVILDGYNLFLSKSCFKNEEEVMRYADKIIKDNELDEYCLGVVFRLDSKDYWVQIILDEQGIKYSTESQGKKIPNKEIGKITEYQKNIYYHLKILD